MATFKCKRVRDSIIKKTTISSVFLLVLGKSKKLACFVKLKLEL